jgi:acyl-CoA dehydrogenase
VQIHQAFLDRCITLLEHKLTTETASMIKYSATDMCGKVVDECLQLFGGYGYMLDYQFQECMLTIVLPGLCWN